MHYQGQYKFKHFPKPKPEGKLTMGIYINPKNMSKEEWLKANSTSAHHSISTLMPSNTREHNGQKEMVVCLVDNGLFTAAGVAFSLDELKAFARPDGRNKIWYWVPQTKLEEVLGEKL